MKDWITTHRNMLFTKIVCLVTLVLTGALSAQDRQISISEALEISYANNNKIKQYYERVQQKTQEDQAAKGNFLPAINLLGDTII